MGLIDEFGNTGGTVTADLSFLQVAAGTSISCFDNVIPEPGVLALALWPAWACCAAFAGPEAACAANAAAEPVRSVNCQAARPFTVALLSIARDVKPSSGPLLSER